MVGPNCIGFMNLFGGVMANFAVPPTEPLPPAGPVALVSQSGGFGSYISTKAYLAGLGLGWFVSTGNESDVNVTTVLRYLVEREETRVVMVFSETLRDPELFIDTACRAAELDKPIVLLKAGRSEVAAKAALSHTASLVGSAEVFDAVARQYGIFLVDTMEEMLDLGMIFQDGRRVKDRRVAIMTTSGGAGVLLADACTQAGLSIPELPPQEQQALLDLMPEPFYGSTTNPVDTTAQVANVPGAFEKVLFGVGASASVDMFAGVTWAIPGEANDAFVAYYQGTDKPVALTSTAWLEDLQRGGVPTYTDPQRAANALGAVARQSLRSSRPARPSEWTPDPARVGKVRPLLATSVGERAVAGIGGQKGAGRLRDRSHQRGVGRQPRGGGRGGRPDRRSGGSQGHVLPASAQDRSRSPPVGRRSGVGWTRVSSFAGGGRPPGSERQDRGCPRSRDGAGPDRAQLRDAARPDFRPGRDRRPRRDLDRDPARDSAPAPAIRPRASPDRSIELVRRTAGGGHPRPRAKPSRPP